MNNNKKAIKVLFVLQLMNILYSLNNVLIKMVSVRWEKEGLFHFQTLFLLFAAILLLVLYAFLWQKVLTQVDLTVAYMCKGMIIFWGMLWAYLFFQEPILLNNILGTLIIFLGTFLVSINE